MIKALNHFFNTLLEGPAENPVLQEEIIHKVSAILMSEIMVSDGGAEGVEKDKIRCILSDAFALPQEEVSEIMAAAEQKASDSVSLFEFTDQVNKVFSPQQKFTLIEHLWHVAYADSVLDKFEEASIRKIAELIHVSHSDFIRAKLNARN